MLTKTWNLIYTRPQQERKVLKAMLEEGIDAFYPTMKSFRIWWDRKKCLDVPLFPSYVFVRLKDKAEYFKSLDIEGVLKYVKFGKEIATVAPAIVDNLKMVINSGREIEVSSDHFQPGAKLVIKEGVFAGLYCEVVKHEGKRKILVRVSLLQRSVLLTITTESLIPA
jgi:transcription antitermination factor NusG